MLARDSALHVVRLLCVGGLIFNDTAHGRVAMTTPWILQNREER